MGCRLPSSACSWVTVQQGPWQWSLRSDVPRSLVETLAVLDDPRAPQATVIKHSTVRRVVRLDETPLGSAVYCKDFAAAGWRVWGRSLFRGSPATWEASRIRLAESRQIPTAELIATGVRYGAWGISGSRLVTRSLDGVRPLSELRPPLELPDPDVVALPDRDAWLQSIATLIARLHGRGLWHGDLHSGNVLLRHTSSGWQSWLIDLAALRAGKEIPLPRLYENLGRFWLSFAILCTPHDRQTFTRYYWETLRAERPQLAQKLGTTADQAWELLQHQTRAALAPVHRTADRAFQRGNSKILIHTDGRSLANLGNDWWVEFRQHLPVLWSHAEPVVEEPGVACRRIVWSTPVGERTLRIWKWECQRSTEISPARLAWEVGHSLLFRGVPVLVPWGLREEASACWLVACEPRQLDPTANTSADSPTSQRLAAQLPQLVAQLQEEGFNVQGDPLAASGSTVNNRWTGWCRLDRLRRRSGATWV